MQWQRQQQRKKINRDKVMKREKKTAATTTTTCEREQLRKEQTIFVKGYGIKVNIFIEV